MGRKSNLGGLAALAGLAYMMTRDKAKKGEAPAAEAPAAMSSASKASEVDPLEAANASAESQKIMADAMADGKKSLAASPAKTTTARPTADSRFVTPEEGAKPYRSRARSDSSLSAPDPREALMRNYVPRRDPKASGAMSGDYMANSAKSRGVRNMYERGAEETGMKKGGSVKGWGMARGARKAKTY